MRGIEVVVGLYSDGVDASSQRAYIDDGGGFLSVLPKDFFTHNIINANFGSALPSLRKMDIYICTCRIWIDFYVVIWRGYKVVGAYIAGGIGKIGGIVVHS